MHRIVRPVKRSQSLVHRTFRPVKRSHLAVRRISRAVTRSTPMMRRPTGLVRPPRDPVHRPRSSVRSAIVPVSRATRTEFRLNRTGPLVNRPRIDKFDSGPGGRVAENPPKRSAILCGRHRALRHRPEPLPMPRITVSIRVRSGGRPDSILSQGVRSDARRPHELEGLN